MPPYGLVFTTDMLGEPCVHRMRSCNLTELMDGRMSWRVNYKSLAYDGDTLGNVLYKTTIIAYEGARKIDQLSVYPFKFHKDREGVERLLLSRADDALKLYSSDCLLREYFGLVLQERKTQEFFFPNEDLAKVASKFKVGLHARSTACIALTVHRLTVAS